MLNICDETQIEETEKTVNGNSVCREERTLSLSGECDITVVLMEICNVLNLSRQRSTWRKC